MSDFCTTNFPTGNVEQKRLCQHILANIPDRIIHLEGQLRRFVLTKINHTILVHPKKHFWYNSLTAFSTIDMVNRVKTEQDETSFEIINELGAVDMDSKRLEEKTEEQEKKLNRVTRTLENLKPRIGEIDNMYEKYAYMVDVMEKKKQVLEEMMDGVNTIHSTMKDMIVNEMAGSKKQAQVI